MSKIKSMDKTLPPQNNEAEQALLGSLLIDKDAIVSVADILEAKDFYKDKHEKIYQAMLDLWKEGEPIDILSTANKLDEDDVLDKVGGRSYLASLSNMVPTSSHAKSYAEIVRKKSTLRKLISSSTDIIKMAYKTEGGNTVDILDQAEEKLFSVSKKFLKQNFVCIKETLDKAFERMDKLDNGEEQIRGVPTGFKELDNAMAGLQPSELILLAARPSIGKSALALDMAYHAAAEKGIPVGIFSLEMSKEQVTDRMISSHSGVDLWKMRTGNISHNDHNSDFEKLGEAFDKLSKAPVYIDDSPLLNLIELKTKARRLQSEHGLGLLVVDYLQLMTSGSDNRFGRVEEVSEISRGLKGVARELNIPVLALSQLSRSPEMRTPAIPKLSDLRSSGALEQDADVVMFLYRKSRDKGIKKIPPEEKNIAEIHIGKHRHGPAGVKFLLYFDESIVSFKDLDKKHQDQYNNNGVDFEEDQDSPF